jgi:pimeloyl-ACP methyl ester carboxylesterase
MKIVLRTSFVTTHGTEVYYEEAGAGPPLVLLHGIGDTHRTFRRVLPYFAQHRRVIAPDLPGCGLSGRPDASYSLEWQADVIGSFLEALGLSEVDLLGHSYGGGVAQYMLLRHRHRIRRLALVASGGLGREVSVELRLASVPIIVEALGQPFMAPVAPFALQAAGGLVGEDEVAWLREVNAKPGTARAFARTVRDVIDWQGQTRHFADRVREVASLPPMALFWGARDRVVPLTQALQTTRMLAGVSLTTFADCTHFPHHQRPEELARDVLAFLEAPDAQPAVFVPRNDRKRPFVSLTLFSPFSSWCEASRPQRWHTNRSHR